MHEALGWLLRHYKSVKLWMGVENDEGAELFLTANPSRRADVVERLQFYEDDLSIFESGPQFESELSTRGTG